MGAKLELGVAFHSAEGLVAPSLTLPNRQNNRQQTSFCAQTRGDSPPRPAAEILNHNTHPGVFSLSYSVTDGEVASAHHLVSVLLKCHTTVASENSLLLLFPNKESSVTVFFLADMPRSNQSCWTLQKSSKVII